MKILAYGEIVLGLFFLLVTASDIQLGFGLMFLLNGIKTLISNCKK